MRKILFILLLLSSGLNAQTFSFECLCTYLTAADSNCDICNANIQSRLFKGILIRKNGTAFKWIDQPYIVQFQGNNATFRELIPNGENITITLAGTPFDSIPQYQDSIKCPCAGSENFFIAGPGIYFSGDTISAFDISPINELQTVDSFYISAGNLYISLDRDSVPASFVTLPVPTGAETIINAGTGISVTGSGTIGSPYIVTNTLPHIATDLAFSGASSPVTLNSSTGTDVTFTAGTGISLAATSSDLTISGNAGTVTSVGLALPTSVFDISGSPVTSTGTLTGTFDNQSANTVFAGPTTGGAATPAFRALAAADITSFATSGTGTLNYVPKWTPNGTTFGLSQIFDNGTNVGIATTSPNTYLSGKTGLTVYGAAPGIAIASAADSWLNYLSANTWHLYNPSAGEVLNIDKTTGRHKLISLSGSGNRSVYASSTGELFASAFLSPSGSGTAKYVTRWFDATTLENSGMYDNGSSGFGIGTATPGTYLVSAGLAVYGANAGFGLANASGNFINYLSTNEWRLYNNSYGEILSVNSSGRFHAKGTVRITGSDGTATTIMGRDGDGDVSALSLSGMSISSGTLTATDGSTTNELQTLAHTSNSTSHTATLSSSGGSLQIIEGAGVLLTTGGTGLNGTVTIEAIDPSTTNEIQTYSASGAGPTSYDMTVSSGGTVTLAEGTGIDLTRSTNTITIASTGITSATGYINGGNSFGGAATIGLNDNFDWAFETNGTTRGWIDNAGTYTIGSAILTTAALNISGLQNGIGMHVAGGTGLVSPVMLQTRGNGSGSTVLVLDAQHSFLNGNVEALIQNTSTSGTGGVIMQLNAKTATGDPRLYMTIDGTTDWSIGIDNDDVDNLKLHRFAAPSDNNGVGTMEFGYDGTSLGVAINKTGIGTAANAHYGLDVGGKVRADQFVNNRYDITSTPVATMAVGTAAGTSPTVDNTVTSVWGNAARLKFTSGSSPTANGVVCTITLGTEYTFNECIPIMQGRSTNAGAFNYSCSYDSGTRVITCTLVGTLTASTVYEFNIIFLGRN